MARATVADKRLELQARPTCKKGDDGEQKDFNDDDDLKRCRYCQSPSLYLDFAQGDRICTNCGVVNEERVRDDRPEWRDFGDDDDLAKGLQSRARCGTVPVDESRYLGGLEPTTLSRNSFGLGTGGLGGSSRSLSSQAFRRQLMRTNRRIDLLMVRQNAKALKQAKLSRRVSQNRLCERKNYSKNIDSDSATDLTDFTEDECNNDNVRPELEQLLIQEEEEAHRSFEALNADKWSLDRAILLHGTNAEQSNSSSQSTYGNNNGHDREAQREDLLQHLDGQMRRAAADLYCAYSMLQKAAHKLYLPLIVVNEATRSLCRYAARKDGFFVKGVRSRLPADNKKTSTSKGKKVALAEEKVQMERLREFNKLKQMASLGAALLHITSRNNGWTRALSDVCSSFQHDGSTLQFTKEDLVKPKHCSKAINEIKALFPDFVRRPLDMVKNGGSCYPLVSDAVSSGNFVEHATRKLVLPPVALASIRFLVSYCRKEQRDLGKESGTKLSTFCASITYFICMAGATMQKLAQQSQTKFLGNDLRSPKVYPNKKRRILNLPIKDTEKKTLSFSKSNKSSSKVDERKNEDDFDVFSHEALEHDPVARTEYQMRRIWDAWSEQMSWSRNISAIEESCGVSRNVVLEYYRKKIYPRRQVLLKALMETSSVRSSPESDKAEDLVDTDIDLAIRDAPLSSVLLSNITAAASLMNNK